MRDFKTLALRSTATLALLGALSLTAQAQVSITEDTSDQILTSTAGEDGAADDVTVDDGVTVTVDSGRSGIILNSDNALVLDGDIDANDIDDVTAVQLIGGNVGSYTQTGDIEILEDFTNEDTDDDGLEDGTFAEGSGRTGILISGTSPFQGDIELESGAAISIEGNDSYGINLSETSGLTGDLTTSGSIAILGDNAIGVNLAATTTGDVLNEGTVSVRGTGSEAYAVSGDINGSFVSSGTLSSSGYRFTSRPSFSGDEDVTGREDLTEEDLQQAGSALNISGNVTGGILLDQVFTEVTDDDGEVLTDDDGNTLFTQTALSAISQLGSAPGVFIGGSDAAPISVGLIADITDPDDEDFNAALQYGFVNQGTVSASGLYDDVDATGVLFSNVTFEGGVSNSGSITAGSFRAPNPTDLSDGDGIARAIVFGSGSTAEEVNNSGTILATVSEAADEIYFDRTDIIAPRDLLAIGLDITEGASVTEIINSGSISSSLSGREGTAIAIRDTSNSVQRLENSGFIFTQSSTSDSLDEQETDFDLTAIDFRTSTNNIVVNQTQNEDSTNTPFIIGNIFLGSGNDTVTAEAGGIIGNLDFGGGSDSLSLSGEAAFLGQILNSDNFALSVMDEAIFTLSSEDDLEVSSAYFGETSTFRPVLNGETGESSALVSTGDITFESGATINPILSSIVGSDTLTYTLLSAGNLSVDDISLLTDGETPFLYNTTLLLEDPNTLNLTLSLRDPSASIEDGGLGLDAVQAAAFGSIVDGEFQNGAVYDALVSVTDLGDAFANISDADDFYAAYNQVLPEFSGAAKQFILANVDGAVGAVGSHLDSARRSPDKTGGAWLEEYFYFADRERAGLSEQYRGEGFGFAGGLDTALGPFHAIGVNAGFSSTKIEDVVGVDDPMNIQTYQLGAYAGLEKSGFSFDLYGGGGISDFEQDRTVSVDTFEGTAQGEWKGVHANASLRTGYEVALGEKFWMRPSVSMDYLYLNEDSYTESGSDGVRLAVEERVSETAAATAMVDFGAKFQGKRTWIRPSIRAGYRNEFISDPVETSFRFEGLTNSDGEVFDSELASVQAFDFPDEALLVGLTVAAGSEYSSFGFDIDSDIRDGFIRHTGRIVVRLLF